MDLEPISTLEAAREPWERLERPTANVFATWSWAAAFWATHGAGRSLALHAVRDGGRLAAILPLYRADRGGVPVLRLLGHGAADELGPLFAPEDAELAADALVAAARDVLPPHGLLLVDRLRGDNPLLGLLPGAVARREPTPVVEAPGLGWEGWLATRSKNFRREVKRRERNVAREHEVRCRVVGDPAELDAAFDTLVALHRARWGDRASQAFAPARERMHRDFARRALARGWLRLWVAELDGAPAAALYNLRFGDGEWFYQAGRDPRFAEAGIGAMLFLHAMRDALQAGVGTLRFGLGDEGYKVRYSTGDPGLHTVVVGRAPTRRAAAAAARMVPRLPTAVRRPLARRVA